MKSLRELREIVKECGHNVRWQETGNRGWNFSGAVGSCSRCGKILSILTIDQAGDDQVAAFDSTISCRIDWKECTKEVVVGT